MQTRQSSAGMARSTRGQASRKTARVLAGKAAQRDEVTSAPKNKRRSSTNSRATKKAPVEVHSPQDDPHPSRAGSSRASSVNHNSNDSSYKSLAASSLSATPLGPQPTIAHDAGDAPTKLTRRRSTPASASPDTSLLALSVASSHGPTKRSRQFLQDEASDLQAEREDEEREFKKRKLVVERLEKRLHSMEEKLKNRADKLDAREANLQVREEELQRQTKVVAAEVSTQTLTYLENSLTCSLCFDILACPTILTPSRCGHTFCFSCILRWYLSKLHDDCGSWHAPVECPLCRTSLPTPNTGQNHRQINACPFAPNRAVEDTLTDLIDSLTSPTKNKSPDPARGRKKKKMPGEGGDQFSGWREGGPARREWQERDRKGKEGRQDLVQRWEGLTAEGFTIMKQNLGITS